MSLLHAAGATPSRATWLFFGACAGEASFQPLVDNLVGILEGARATILGTGEIGEPEYHEALGGLASFRARPEAAMWYAISWAEGVKPLVAS